MLKDWRVHKLPYYTLPTTNATITNGELCPEVLATLRTRKECRKASGLVRLHAGVKDVRRFDSTLAWSQSGKPSEEDTNDDGCRGLVSDENEDHVRTGGKYQDRCENSTASSLSPTQLAAELGHRYKRLVTFAEPPKGRSNNAGSGRAKKRTLE